MTIELQEYKCPLCEHELGEIEYRHVCEKNDELVQQLAEKKLYLQKIQHGKELQRLREKHDLEMNQVNVRSQEMANQEKVRMELSYKQELADKDKTIEQVRQQNTEQLNDIKVKYLQSEKENELKLKRLETKLEEQQKIIDSKSSELKGTAGEFVLLELLEKEFPKDLFTTKKNGKAMSDIIQTIVTERGPLPTPIVYDVKMGDKVTRSDIAKAKNYMSIHKTPHSIIVTKDIKNGRYSEDREGVPLVHPLLVIDMAKQIRKSLIDTGVLIRNNTNRNAKESKMYRYFTSQEYTRNVTKRIELKLKYDNIYRRVEALRKQENNCIEELVELDSKNDAIIMDITQGDTDIQNQIESFDDEPESPSN